MRIVLLISIVLLILAIALTGSHILVERLFIVTAVLMLLDYVFVRVQVWGLKGKLQNYGQKYHAGETFQVEAVVVNNLVPKTFVKLLVKTGVSQPEAQVLLDIASGATCTWQARLTFPQRGKNRLGPLVAEVSDPFGLFRQSRILDPGKEVLVYPKIVEFSFFQDTFQFDEGREISMHPSSEISGVFSGIREYIPGDSINRIHWRTSARIDKLMVKEFAVQPEKEAWIIPDLDHSFKIGTGSESLEEYIVDIAASAANRYFISGRQVGLIAQGTEFLYYAAGRGQMHYGQIMEALAILKLNGHVPIHRLLDYSTNIFNPGSIVIIVTASSRLDLVDAVFNLRKKGSLVQVVLLDPDNIDSNLSMQCIQSQLLSINVTVCTFKLDRGLIFSSRKPP